MKIFISVIGLLVLTACSGNNTLNRLSKVPGLESLSEETVVLDPNALAVVDQIGKGKRKAVNVIRIERNAALDMLEIAREGDRSSYMSATRRAIILQNGIITQTQGIGGDLAISQHEHYELRYSGVFTKTHGYLGGDNKIHTVTFRCIRTLRPTDYFGLREQRRLLTPVDEVCSNDEQSHENVYFLHPNTGTVFRSRQWVSDQIGYLRIQQVQLPQV